MRRSQVCTILGIAAALCCYWLPGESAGLQSQNGVPREPPVKKIRVNGVDLAYVVQGRGEPVVLLHGFLHDYRVWSEQMDAFAVRHRVIAYSRRYRYPFAPPPEGADTTLAADIEDLAALIKALKLGRVHLLGHSGGAHLAMLFTRKHPDLVRSMILGEGPPPRPSGEGPATRPGPPPFVAEARKAYDRGDTEGAMRIFAQGVLGKSELPSRPSLREIPLANVWQLKRLGVPDTSVPPFTCEDAGRIPVPTLVLEGELSPPRARASAEAWRKCLPSSEHAMLPQSSHGLQLENPAAFNEIVVAFLTRHAGSIKAAAAELPPVKKIRVNGADLAYVEQGRGQPVVLIHGWLWDYRVWSAQLPELSKRYRAIAYSRRHNYPNQGVGEYSTSSDVADLVAFIKALKLGRVHLVGHSAGGSLALLVARDHPELVRSLTLGEAFMPDWLSQNSEAQSLLQTFVAILGEAHKAFQKGDLPGAARILADGIVGKAGAFGQMPPERQSQILENMKLEMKAELSAPPKPEPSFTCEDARRIKAPTLLLEGDRTVRIFQLMTQALHDCMPGSERAVLPNATHGLELENPAGFNEIVLGFLTRTRGKTAR